MRNVKLTVLLLFQLCFNHLTCQEAVREVLANYKNVPREKVFVSINSSLLFSGEYLLYTVFCLNDKTKQASGISKMAYVELIGETGQPVFSHKIWLENSRGKGDFFVPTTVPSGNYKLIAYTRWMRNGDMNLFFQEDVTVVNPYRSNQDALLPGTMDKDSSDIGTDRGQNLTKQDRRFVLEADKVRYGKRSRAILSIKNFRGASGYGNYRISVRKKQILGHESKHSPTSFVEAHADRMGDKKAVYDSIRFLPERSGFRIKGRLVSQSTGGQVANKKVSISIPGEDFQLKVVRTDSTGGFSTEITKAFRQPLAIFQLLDVPVAEFKIEIEEDVPLDYGELNFGQFYLRPQMREAILERSIYNQIENAYFSVKPDTVTIGDLNDPYGGAYVETVVLDEFTRFKTLGETIVEIVPNVWTKRIGRGRYVFKVRSFDEAYEESEFDALVLIDGVLITDVSELPNFEAKKIKQINTVREKFLLGGKTYFGMVNLETINGDYHETIPYDGVKKVPLGMPPIQKKYFKQNYNDPSLAGSVRIPDFRQQLLWLPDLEIRGKEAQLDFYTSDLPGEYEVGLEGFSIYGRPVSVYGTIIVE